VVVLVVLAVLAMLMMMLMVLVLLVLLVVLAGGAGGRTVGYCVDLGARHRLATVAVVSGSRIPGHG